MLTGLFEEIIKQGGYDANAQHIATGLVAMHAGLWLDLLLSPAEMSLEQAQEMSMSYLQGVFPGHFAE